MTNLITTVKNFNLFPTINILNNQIFEVLTTIVQHSQPPSFDDIPGPEVEKYGKALEEISKEFIENSFKIVPSFIEKTAQKYPFDKNSFKSFIQKWLTYQISSLLRIKLMTGNIGLEILVQDFASIDQS